MQELQILYQIYAQQETRADVAKVWSLLVRRIFWSDPRDNAAVAASWRRYICFLLWGGSPKTLHQPPPSHFRTQCGPTVWKWPGRWRSAIRAPWLSSNEPLHLKKTKRKKKATREKWTQSIVAAALTRDAKSLIPGVLPAVTSNQLRHKARLWEKKVEQRALTCWKKTEPRITDDELVAFHHFNFGERLLFLS